MLLPVDNQRNDIYRAFPERQIQRQLLCVRSTVGRARAVNGWFRVGAVHLQGLSHGPNAYCGAISGVCVGIPYLRTETYDTLLTYRTLAASESVAPVHVVYFGRAKALMRWVPFESLGTQNPELRTTKHCLKLHPTATLWTQCIPHSGILRYSACTTDE